jgi:hypothetical protein
MSHANSNWPTLPDDTNSRPNWRDVIEDVVAADFNALESMLRTLQDRAGNNTYGGGPSDFFAYPHPSGGLRLRLNPGTLITAGGLVAWIAQQDTTALTAPVTNPRIDVAALDTTTGAVSWVAGTEAASPTVPTVPAGKAAAWAVYLRVGATAIDRFAVDIGTNSYLYRDLRRAIAAGGGGAVGGAPALTLGTANTDGTSGLFVETDAALAIFDATVPVTQAYSDAAATGSAARAARRDHRHGMPASGGLPTMGSGSASRNSGDVTTTSTSFADVTGMSITMTTVGGPVLLSFNCVNYNSTTAVNCFDFTVDGTRQNPSAAFGLVALTSPAGGPNMALSMVWLTAALSAASHTFTVQWKVNVASTGTVRADGTNFIPQFRARELL